MEHPLASAMCHGTRAGKRRRQQLIGMAVTLPFALSGCALADRTVGLVSDLSKDALAFLDGEKKAGIIAPLVRS